MSNGCLRARPRPMEIASATPAMIEDLVGQLVQLLGERRRLGGLPLQHVGDVADLGRHARRRHDERRRAAGHLRVHERHVDAVAERGLRSDRVDALRDRRAFAGQGRFVDLERRRAQDPAVGRDQVARLDVHDVARDELLHRDLDDLAATADLGLDDHHLLKGCDARLGLAFLVHPEEGVEQRQPDQQDARRELVGQEQADPAGDEQDDLHRVAVLPQERLPGRLLRRLRELVRAVGLRAGSRPPRRTARSPARPSGPQAPLRRSSRARPAVRRCHRAYRCGHVRTTSALFLRRSAEQDARST